MYPFECRALGITGSGIVLAIVDKKTGTVVGARMLKSIGNRLLDASALEALSRWRFKQALSRK
jgi:TonB family protein